VNVPAISESLQGSSDLCVPSDVFRNLKGRYISGVHFQKCSKFSIIFFTLNISTKFFHPKERGKATFGGEKNTCRLCTPLCIPNGEVGIL